jgi:hypothetical protein
VYRKLQFIALLLPLLSVSVPSTASAQWRRYPPYPYPAYRNYQPESSLRLDVKPRDASVYIDGYFAGKVDEFDGKLQRLHVEPGEHEIVVYLDGYRPLTQRLYLSPNGTRTIDGQLEKLAAGDVQPPPPQPSEDARLRRRDDPRLDPSDRDAVPPFRGPAGPPRRRDPGVEDDRDRGGSRESALSIRVQPSGASVRVDGERWDGPDGRDDRLVIQVSEGHHVIEIERDGYERFTTEVEVRRGETRTLNVSLRRDGR